LHLGIVQTSLLSNEKANMQIPNIHQLTLLTVTQFRAQSRSGKSKGVDCYIAQANQSGILNDHQIFQIQFSKNLATFTTKQFQGIYIMTPRAIHISDPKKLNLQFL